ncbi:MAG: tyrosine-type recombinase/integrase [Aminivibrio sp.]
MALCRRIEGRGLTDTANRVKQLVGQIFRYAIATDRVSSDPTAALHGALSPHKSKHYASLKGGAAIGALMRAIDAYPQAVVRCALRFSALVFCRPGEIRRAEWQEVNFEGSEWRISAEKMKAGRPHIVPLSHQALATLEELREFTGGQRWLFPSARRDGRCMSENTVRVALRSMGYGNEDMTAHGFRSMASTALNENGWPVDVIERQLAHAERSAVRAAYNHAEYLGQRREMMQWWGDWLDSQQKGRGRGGD